MVRKYNFHLYSNRADYGSKPDFRSRGLEALQGFISLYAVTSETAKAIKQTGTTKWFKGVVWSERLWLDFDSYGAAERAESKLERLGYDYRAYDTGGRGAHFGILRTADPSHLLPNADKKWAKEHFPEADQSIYTHLHPFRLPGTIHEETGNRKLLVCEHRGSALALPAFKPEELPIAQIQANNTGRAGSIFDCWRVISNTVPVLEGKRHETLIKLLYALRDVAQCPPDIALWWVSEWNKMLSEPKSDDEIQKAFRSIYG